MRLRRQNAVGVKTGGSTGGLCCIAPESVLVEGQQVKLIGIAKDDLVRPDRLNDPDGAQRWVVRIELGIEHFNGFSSADTRLNGWPILEPSIDHFPIALAGVVRLGPARAFHCIGGPDASP